MHRDTENSYFMIIHASILNLKVGQPVSMAKKMNVLEVNEFNLSENLSFGQ